MTPYDDAAYTAANNSRRILAQVNAAIGQDVRLAPWDDQLETRIDHAGNRVETDRLFAATSTPADDEAADHEAAAQYGNTITRPRTTP